MYDYVIIFTKTSKLSTKLYVSSMMDNSTTIINGTFQY
jgi:hypothetical protein